MQGIFKMIRFRLIDEADREKINDWISKDPGHAGKMDADFFVKQPAGWGAFAIVEEGEPLMYVAQEPDGLNLRLHVQFPPDNLRQVIKGMIIAYPVIAQNARDRGFKHMAFESESRALLRFMSRFGFKQEMRSRL